MRHALLILMAVDDDGASVPADALLDEAGRVLTDESGATLTGTSEGRTPTYFIYGF